MNKLAQIYLIDENKLKLYSDITRNVGINKIIPYVALAQPFFIDDVLGTPLVAELTLQVADNTLTEANEALMLKIAPALALYTQYIAMRGLTYTIAEKGIVKFKSENSETISEKELAEFIYSTKENAELAKELLIKYLCECSDQYPLWKPSQECNCNKYLKVNEGTASLNVSSHIYFPKRNNNSCGCNKK